MRTLLILSFGVLLAACQAPMRPDANPFRLNPDMVGATETIHTSSRDAYGKTEVLSATGDRGWLSAALISSNSMGVITESAEAPRLFLKGWKALNGKVLAYGETGKADTISYERFSFATNNCFQFHKLNAHSVSDDLARYRQLLAGYACVHTGKEIPAQAIEMFLGGISVPRDAANAYEKDPQPVTLLTPIFPVRTRLQPEIMDPAS